MPATIVIGGGEWAYQGKGATITGLDTGQRIIVSARLASSDFVSDWTDGHTSIYLNADGEAPVLSVAGDLAALPGETIDIVVNYLLYDNDRTVQLPITITGQPSWLTMTHVQPTSDSNSGYIRFTGTAPDDPSSTMSVSLTDDENHSSTISFQVEIIQDLVLEGAADIGVSQYARNDDVLQLSASGGRAPYVYELLGDDVPAGITLDGANLSVQLETLGITTIQVQVTDDADQTDTAIINIDVVEPINLGRSASYTQMVFWHTTLGQLFVGAGVDGTIESYVYRIDLEHSVALDNGAPGLPYEANVGTEDGGRLYYIRQGTLHRTQNPFAAETNIGEDDALLLTGTNREAIQDGFDIKDGVVYALHVVDETEIVTTNHQVNCREEQYNCREENGETVCDTRTVCDMVTNSYQQLNNRQLKLRRFNLSDESLVGETTLEEYDRDTDDTSAIVWYYLRAVAVDRTNGDIYLLMRKTYGFILTYQVGIWKVNATLDGLTHVTDLETGTGVTVESQGQKYKDMAANAGMIYILDTLQDQVIYYDATGN